MEKVTFGETLTFDNNQEYVCYGRVKIDNNDYLCLVNKNNMNDRIVALELFNNNELNLEIIENDNIIQRVYSNIKENKLDEIIN